MSTEDRLRAATRARTDLVRDIRPLELPDDLPAPARPRHSTRRWLGWGAPVAAAALVTALALVLVLLRQTPDPQSGGVPAASGVAVPASPPRYYVALAYVNPASSNPIEAVVGDDRTGQRLAVIRPSASQNFYGVTAAADDRTFVLMNYGSAQKETTWYRLRLTPGSAHPAQLAKLPMKPLAAQVSGLALSPDGRELAVMYRTATTQTNAVSQLLIYSMSSGSVLHDWRTYGDNVNLIGNGNVAGLAWVDGDRGVTFRWGTPVKSVSDPGKLTFRTLDVTAAGHDLLADSRVVLQLPTGVGGHGTGTIPCSTSLAIGDGKAVVCGTTGYNFKSAACPATPPSYVSYSTATGKPVKVLWRYPGQCVNGRALLLWTDPSGSQAVGLVGLVKSVNGKNTAVPALFGFIVDGRFTPLPAPVVHQDAMDSPGGIAF